MSERVNANKKTADTNGEKSSLGRKKTDFSSSINSPIDQILFLQRTVGNQAVQDLLKSGFIQAKLTIGQPGDIYEQEADRVAEQVIRMPDLSQAQRKGVSEDDKVPSVQRACTGCEEELHRQTNGIQIQRICTECEEELQRQPMEEEEELLQTKKVSGSTPEVTPSVESQINSIRGGGESLSDSVRSFFEPRFGQDFSQVRIHTDSNAGESAKAVNALAYTVGQDIVFGSGQYAPGTTAGKTLLAHELTHVVQQKSARKMSLSGITTSSSKRVYDCLQRVVRSVSCQNATGRVREIVGDNPLGTVQAADARAIEMLDNAIDQLVRTQERIRGGKPAAWPELSDALASSLQDRFGIDPTDRELWTSRQRLTPRGRPTISLLLFRLNRVRETLASGRLRYSCLDRPPCPPMSQPGEVVIGAVAFADSEQYRIYLCEGFWRDDPAERPLTLVHEAFHIYFGAPEHSGRNMWNPSCIELFMCDSNGVTIPEEMERCCAPGGGCNY